MYKQTLCLSFLALFYDQKTNTIITILILLAKYPRNGELLVGVGQALTPEPPCPNVRTRRIFSSAPWKRSTIRDKLQSPHLPDLFTRIHIPIQPRKAQSASTCPHQILRRPIGHYMHLRYGYPPNSWQTISCNKLICLCCNGVCEFWNWELALVFPAL